MTPAPKRPRRAELERRQNGLSARCRQHPARQRSLCRRPGRTPGTGVRRPPNARATGQSSAACASNWDSPTTWELCRHFAPDSTIIPNCLPCPIFCWSIRSQPAAFPRALEAVAHLGKLGRPAVLSDGDIVFQPRKIQRSGIWDAVDGRVMIYRAQGACARPRAAALPREALRHGRRQAESAGGHEIRPQDETDDRVRAPGALCARPGGQFRRTRRRTWPSSASGISSTTILIRLPGAAMTITKRLHDLGQSLWLDNITRDILDNGTLRRYIDELSVTGLTSNPTIFDEAIGNTAAYDAGIRQKARGGPRGRGSVRRDCARGSAPRRRFVPAGVRPHAGHRRLGFHGSVAAAGERHQDHASRPRCASTSRPRGPICTSRFPARRPACPPSRRPFSPAYRST